MASLPGRQVYMAGSLQNQDRAGFVQRLATDRQFGIGDRQPIPEQMNENSAFPQLPNSRVD